MICGRGLFCAISLCIYTDMKYLLYLVLAAFTVLTSRPAHSNPVDLTGLSCVRETAFGPNIWEFYGDIAVRNYPENQGRPQRFIRVGEGAYERYSRSDGEWEAVYYFFRSRRWLTSTHIFEAGY